MKRVLLIGFILAILILAMPQGVLAGTTQPATVTATINPYLDLTIGPNPTSWAMASGSTVTPVVNNFYTDKSAYPIALTVETNRNWEVRADNTVGTDKGFMKAAVTNVALRSAMDITTADGGDPTGSWTALSNGNILIASGLRPPTALVSFNRNLRQAVYSNDPPENPYSITITFTASNV
jgi:hypothetical protein